MKVGVLLLLLLSAGAGREPEPKLNAGVLLLPAGAGSDPEPKEKAGVLLLLLPAGAGREPVPKLKAGEALAVEAAAEVLGAVVVAEGVGAAAAEVLLLLDPKVNGAAAWVEEAGAAVDAPKPAPVETKEYQNESWCKFQYKKSKQIRLETVLLYTGTGHVCPLHAYMQCVAHVDAYFDSTARLPTIAPRTHYSGTAVPCKCWNPPTS